MNRRTQYKNMGTTGADSRKQLAQVERQAQRSVHQRMARAPANTVYVISDPGEVKSIDTPLDTALVPIDLTSNSGCVLLNAVQVGSSNFQRIGKRIKPRALRLSGILVGTFNIDTLPPNDRMQGQCARMVVVYDRQPGATLPAFNDVFRNQEADGTLSDSFTAALRPGTYERFSVLRDSIVDLNPNFATASLNKPSTYSYHFDEYIKIPAEKFPISYASSSSPVTVADIATGAFYVYFRASRLSESGKEEVEIEKSQCRFSYTE